MPEKSRDKDTVALPRVLSPEELEVLKDFDEEDWEGIIARAEREGLPINQLKLAKRKRELTPEQQAEQDAVGLLARSQREKIEVTFLPKRSHDNPWVLLGAIHQMLVKAGYPEKSDSRDTEGPVTGRFNDKEIEMLQHEAKENGLFADEDEE